MPVEFTEGAPEGTENKIADWLPDISRFSEAGGALQPSISEGYEVGYLSVAGIEAGELLDAVQSKRWRHLVLSGPQALGELELDEANEPVALHSGSGKDGFLAAIDKAEQMKEEYRASVLISPALRFVALWLHRDGDNLIMPYPPNATSLKNYAPISVADALKVLQPMAKEIMASKAGDTPLGG